MRSRKFWLIPPLFILCFGLGCLLGIVLPEKGETVVETTMASVQTVPETSATVSLSSEEKLYADYLRAVEEYQDSLLSDLDHDGISELLIYRYGNLNEVATVLDGEVVQVLREHDMFRCADGIIADFGEGSGGCTVFFKQIKAGKAETLVCLVYHWNEDTWYRSTDGSGNDASLVPISEAERHSVLEKYPCIDEGVNPFMLEAIYE